MVGDLTPILEAVGSHPIGMTPHLLAPVDGGRGLDRVAVLQSGAYNAGWLSVTDSPVARTFL